MIESSLELVKKYSDIVMGRFIVRKGYLNYTGANPTDVFVLSKETEVLVLVVIGLQNGFIQMLMNINLSFMVSRYSTVRFSRFSSIVKH